MSVLVGKNKGARLKLNFIGWLTLQLAGAWLEKRAGLSAEEAAVLAALPDPNPSSQGLGHYWRDGTRQKTVWISGLHVEATRTLLQKAADVLPLGQTGRVLLRAAERLPTIDPITMLGSLAG